VSIAKASIIAPSCFDDSTLILYLIRPAAFDRTVHQRPQR